MSLEGGKRELTPKDIAYKKPPLQQGTMLCKFNGEWYEGTIMYDPDTDISLIPFDNKTEG